MILLLFLGLLVTWLVLGLFVLDVVVADAGNLAAVMVWLVVAAWSGRRRKDGHASMWAAAAFSIMTFFLFIHDLATEHGWPTGQLHDLLIARRIGMLPVLACLAMAAIAFLRKKRRTAGPDGAGAVSGRGVAG